MHNHESLISESYNKGAFMKKFVLIALVLSTVLFLVANELSDRELEEQALKDMLSTLQYTAGSRFGNDLKVGDKVVYHVNTDFSSENQSEEFVSLEVIEESSKGIVIKESFDRNITYTTWDPVSNQIVDFYGYDENRCKQTPKLLHKSEVEANFSLVKSQASALIPFSFSQNDRAEYAVSVNSRDITCSKVNMEIPEMFKQKLAQDQLDQIEEESAMYFSDEIPKLIPFVEVTLSMLNSLETLNQQNKGFVKNSVLELIEFRKGN